MYCFMCGFELVAHCLKCGKSVTTFKHSYCPFAAFITKIRLLKLVVTESML
ncbi:hypothetical protein [Nostoc sp. KVJ3]|uniref:hypothetical protein n=1 Tax=Nostoc sp. KVJ3 TaxID=457945 RepID=UPI0039DFE03F